jgi:SagB-type dehydrogenase family enzyme
MALAVVACALLVVGFGAAPASKPAKAPKKPTPAKVKAEEAQPLRPIADFDLPPPQTKGKVSLEEALAARRSERAFRPDPLTLAQIGQLMWAAQGITDAVRGYRTAPSAGATYPIELYLLTPEGVYHYVPQGHRLELLDRSDLRGALANSALGQECVRDAPLDVVIASVPARTTPKYRDRAARYIYLEAGHIAQNLLLEATAIGLGGVSVGAFQEEEVRQVLGLPKDQYPVYLVPLGHAQ